MNLGTTTIGSTFPIGYSVLANKNAFSYHPIGATIDWTTIAAEAAPRTLASGYVTTIGEKIIPAGSVLYKLTPGSASSLWGVAVAATALVVGETLLCEHDESYNMGSNQIGDVFDNGNVIQARILYGGAAATLANIKAAMPALRLFT